MFVVRRLYEEFGACDELRKPADGASLVFVTGSKPFTCRLDEEPL